MISNQDDLLKEILHESLNERKAARRWSILFKVLFFAYLTYILLAVMGKPGIPSNEPFVARVDIEGFIGTGGDNSLDALKEKFQRVYDSPQAKGILLQINSPGGSPVESSLIHQYLREAQREHPEIPVVAVVTSKALSGGYYVASAVDTIYAQPSSLVGSIGVVMFNFGVQELLAKWGIEPRILTAGDNKSIGSPFEALSPEHQKSLEALLADMHQEFIQLVKASRGERLDLSDEDTLFSGQLWSGVKAEALGLIDGIATPDQIMKDVFEVQHVVRIESRRSPFSAFTRMGAQIGTGFSSGILQSVSHLP